MKYGSITPRPAACSQALPYAPNRPRRVVRPDSHGLCPQLTGNKTPCKLRAMMCCAPASHHATEPRLKEACAAHGKSHGEPRLVACCRAPNNDRGLFKRLLTLLGKTGRGCQPPLLVATLTSLPLWQGRGRRKSLPRAHTHSGTKRRTRHGTATAPRTSCNLFSFPHHVLMIRKRAGRPPSAQAAEGAP